MQCWVVLSGPLSRFFASADEEEQDERPLPSVPVTRMPSLEAASMSIPLLRREVLRRSFRLGSWEKREAGKGVRSRIEEITVYGLRRSMSWAWISGVVEG